MEGRMAKEMAQKDYKSSLKPIWCPGCGDYGVLNALYRAFDKLSLKPENIAVVSGIGCSGRLPGYVNAYGFHTVHGRAVPIATGVKIANPELTVIAVGGDGDGYSIGAGHLPHAARRNVDITYVVMNNGTYALTKGQHSPTSLADFRAKPTQLTPLEEALNPIAQAIACDVSFVARGYSFAKEVKLVDVLIQAIQHKGFALIDTFSPCPTFNVLQAKEYKERAIPIPKEHDITDKFKAFALAYETEHIPIGVFYKIQKPTLQDKIEELNIIEEKTSLDDFFEKFY